MHKAKIRDAILGVALFVLGALPAQAEEALWALLSSQTASSGEFVQEVYDEDDDLLDRSHGYYAVMRPGFFRWEISSPDRQLLVVSGDTLWHYDMDLATATRRSTAGDSAFAPLELLGGDPAELRERFQVAALADGGYRLQPTYAAAGFASVDLYWEGERLTAMTVVDRSGQRLQLALAPTAPDTPLTEADFTFEPPEGVEIYYDDGV